MSRDDPFTFDRVSSRTDHAEAMDGHWTNYVSVGSFISVIEPTLTAPVYMRIIEHNQTESGPDIVCEDALGVTRKPPVDRYQQLFKRGYLDIVLGTPQIYPWTDAVGLGDQARFSLPKFPDGTLSYIESINTAEAVFMPDTVVRCFDETKSNTVVLDKLIIQGLYKSGHFTPVDGPKHPDAGSSEPNGGTGSLR